MYIKDLQSGKVRKYGTDCHDSLRISSDGRTLTYYNLQNGDGSGCGEYRFCDENGNLPCDIPFSEGYFNIGGFDEIVRCEGCKHYYLDADAGSCAISQKRKGENEVSKCKR